ncbi:hypothetical protein [Corynebacterium liangguodongii]|uniref:Uncharacterized protein n=1 Tax=Corynebacterium liangguodongii TaxID=2079535 RepID=A0A2S0WC42_9CORY|nr:hypothetical protein [Corynebacterium liangguodongii]AWB83252.1 hypothetical protein C3E79_01110 [Corynebacterium liangguodongii]PWC00658.1 hypothetical protein DF219_01840 [Corynebacterium liangguodongii]
MTTEWSVSEFAKYMNSLLKRYVAPDDGLPPEAIEVRAAWKTPQYVYCVFSVKFRGGLAYAGMEMPPMPDYEDVSSEEDTAVKGWADQLAGDPFIDELDYGPGDDIEWLGGMRDFYPRNFSEVRRMKEGDKIDGGLYLPRTNHG